MVVTNSWRTFTIAFLLCVTAIETAIIIDMGAGTFLANVIGIGLTVGAALR